MTDFLYIQIPNSGPSMEDGLPILMEIGSRFICNGYTFQVHSYSLPDEVFHGDYDLVVICYEVESTQDMVSILRDLKIDKLINK